MRLAKSILTNMLRGMPEKIEWSTRTSIRVVMELPFQMLSELRIMHRLKHRELVLLVKHMDQWLAKQMEGIRMECLVLQQQCQSHQWVELMEETTLT